VGPLVLPVSTVSPRVKASVVSQDDPPALSDGEQDEARDFRPGRRHRATTAAEASRGGADVFDHGYDYDQYYHAALIAGRKLTTDACAPGRCLPPDTRAADVSWAETRGCRKKTDTADFRFILTRRGPLFRPAEPGRELSTDKSYLRELKISDALVVQVFHQQFQRSGCLNRAASPPIVKAGYPFVRAGSSG